MAGSKGKERDQGVHDVRIADRFNGRGAMTLVAQCLTRFFSSKSTDAAALAISPAESTEISTSATCSAGESLIPCVPASPRRVPDCYMARMMRCVCAGVNRAKSQFVSLTLPTPQRTSFRPCLPGIISPAAMPTLWHPFRVMRILSPR